jgi:hypothetical protein
MQANGMVSIIAGFYAMFPIKAVAQPLAFALKVFAVVVVANIVGLLLYAIRGKRNRVSPHN